MLLTNHQSIPIRLLKKEKKNEMVQLLWMQFEWFHMFFSLGMDDSIFQMDSIWVDLYTGV